MIRNFCLCAVLLILGCDKHSDYRIHSADLVGIWKVNFVQLEHPSPVLETTIDTISSSGTLTFFEDGTGNIINEPNLYSPTLSDPLSPFSFVWKIDHSQIILTFPNGDTTVYHFDLNVDGVRAVVRINAPASEPRIAAYLEKQF